MQIGVLDRASMSDTLVVEAWMKHAQTFIRLLVEQQKGKLVVFAR
jgi:hypothetical protein